MIKDDLEAEDDDELQQGGDEYDDNVPQSSVSDVVHNQPELESHCQRTFGSLVPLPRGETKNSDFSAIKLERKTIVVCSMELSWSKERASFDLLTTHIRSQLPNKFEDPNVTDKDFGKQWTQTAC